MKERLRILYVAYPLLPVTEESCGGAEQALLVLEREMARRGHATVVAACHGSRVTGELYASGAAAGGLDQLSERDLQHNARIRQLLAHDDGFDLVHDMSGTFWKCAGEVEVPVLATLHLPPVLYAPEMFEEIAANVAFNCVSRAQADLFRNLPRMTGVVANGIDVERFPFSARKQPYLLWLGRICEEKGAHVALDVAEAAGLPLVLAGQVYPFRYHQQYFEREVRPRLERNPRSRFVKRPTFEEKVELMRGARALLVPSLIDETSSLAAMEAMTCGTPVVGFRRGALPEVVEDGVTGFLATSMQDLISALSRTGDIDPCACREHVARRFPMERMADDYGDLYQRVLQLLPRVRRGMEAA